VIWGGLLGALAIVFVIGGSARGSTRWIEIGAFRLQPSELGKVGIIVVLAGLVMERRALIGTRRLTLMALGVTLVPAGVVFLQPDLGTSLVYGVAVIAVLFLAGAPWHHFAVLGATLVAAVLLILVVLPTAGLSVLKDYQVDRLTAFVDSSNDPSDSGYQLEQSKIAIGAGGAFGRGPDGASQTTNQFLPEHHTDFIFAVVAEMFGFVGAGLLIVAIGFVCWRGLRIAARAPTQTEQLVAGAIVAALVFQTFVNIGMNLGIMPITGIPLPFMSYGGSHTLTNLIAVGLLLRIGRGQATGTA
jgi:rod shape determining protein RodA